MLTLLMLALPLQSQVWTVDASGGPGADFNDLPPAIAAASAGDVLLIRSGNYSAAQLGVGLTLQADEDANVQVAGLRVESVPAGQHVVIAGLTSPSFAWISSCDGMVWIEDCRFAPPAAQDDGDFEAAVHVQDCADVVLVDTVGIGRDLNQVSSFAAPEPTPGLLVSNSAVHVFQCTFEGGDGGWLETPSGPGIGFPLEMEPAPGARHESGELFALASAFVGGQGHSVHHPYYATCVDAPGGPGVTALAPIYVRDSELVGGPEGFDVGFCPPSPEAPPWSGVPPIELDGESVSLDVPAPIRENGTFDLTLTGTPGVLAVLGLSTSQDAILVPAWGGGLVIQGPYLILPPVAIPPSGTLTLTMSLLDLGPSVEALKYYAQVAALDAGGAFTVNDPTVTVLLDDQF
jgi:hypothetical protein